MMTAEEIWQRLDEAGLTPPVHWQAAPADWRTAIESIADEIEWTMYRMVAPEPVRLASPLPRIPMGQLALDQLAKDLSR